MKDTPENRVKQEIKDYLDIMGWFHFHNLQQMGSYKGIPDRVAVKDGIVLFIECKAPGKYLTGNQERFKFDLVENGGHYVKAECLEDIEKYLTGLE